MKLIDANKLSKDIQDYFTDKINKGKYEVDTVDCNADIQAILRKQPTAYDPDKIMEQLEKPGNIAVEYNYGMSKDEIAQSVLNQVQDRAIEIVKSGGKV